MKSLIPAEKFTKIEEPSINMAFIQEPLENFRQLKNEKFITGILAWENDSQGPSESQNQKTCIQDFQKQLKTVTSFSD